MLNRNMLLMTVLAVALPLAAGKAATLAYDTSSLQVVAGQSITVGATLTLGLNEGPLVTDGTGSGLSVYQPLSLDGMLAGSPDALFAQDTSFTAASPDPVANLDVPAGGSVHLPLGTIATLASLPIGVYSIDIGINEACTATYCLLTPFMPPSYADAGFLTINVIAESLDPVPEPATAALLPGALAGIALARRRRV